MSNLLLYPNCPKCTTLFHRITNMLTRTLFAKTNGILWSVANEYNEEHLLSPKAINERGKGGLQSLAGYVVRKSLMATQKIKDPKEREAATLILQNAITSDAEFNSHNKPVV